MITAWQALEKGIVTGCIILAILFVMGMNLIIKAAAEKVEARRRHRSHGDYSSREARSRRSSRCLFRAKRFPSIVNNPIKCLGKWFDANLNDSNNIRRLQGQVKEGLGAIDKIRLPGKFKALLFQYGLLPRLTWPLIFYEVTKTTVKALERTISKFLRRWLAVPPSFTSRRERGGKWSESNAVEAAEIRLSHQDIVGTTCVGRQGLGTSHVLRWGTSDKAGKRKMVQDDIRKMEEEIRKAKVVEMGAQGAWTRWGTTDRRLSWSDIWRMEPCRIQFLLRSVYDLLPSPTNLHRWGLTETPDCPLCNRPGNLAHVLSGCNVVLTRGRYKWRHDKVLKELANILERERIKKRKPATSCTFINFVRGREGGHTSSTVHQGVSLTAHRTGR
ncbi:uncharacterized protein [Argopecten irradians]|uniref:uncharacterized protein n=1 Tax=Argopecten irradians TaxID=31199 RepID=UPI00371AB416